MKLIRTHLVPGGVVKTYQEGKSDIVAKYATDLLKESGSEAQAMYALADDLIDIATAIQEKANEITRESPRHEVLLRVREANGVTGQTKDERRKEFLAKMAEKRAAGSPDQEQEDPYGNEAS